MGSLDALLALEQHGIKLGLDNIRILTSALAKPQDSFRSVIVAGTNGKGSVTAMVESALRAAGHHTGRYTSPHLVRLEERFAIDGRSVSTERLTEVAERVLRIIDRLRADGGLSVHPTFFEATTAIAFEIFRDHLVEVAVLEVGLGGRFDATNVVTPVIGAITSIDLDHERYLGSTIREIAFEKAGIVKPGIAVVVGDLSREARDVVARVCEERGAQLVPAAEEVETMIATEAGRIRLTATTRRGRYGPVVLALRGRHQAANAVVAIRLLEELDRLGISVPAGAIMTGLSTTRWPGRLDLIELEPGRRVLLDAAHNPAGARALAEYLRETYSERLPIVFGAMRDKDAGRMLEGLVPVASRFIFTQAVTPRAAPVEVLEAEARSLRLDLPITLEPDPRAALDCAWTFGPLVVVAGSLFVVGDLLAGLPASNAR